MSVSIAIQGLTKTFGNVTALDRVNLKIAKGEFIVLLGPSGCGKTTLLRSIAGLETPDEGAVIIGDDVVYSFEKGIIVPPGKRNVGMVFQSYALWPHMRVNENIGFGLRLQKVPRKEMVKRVDRVLEDLSMEGLGDRYPSELSGGQQQRVAVARLLATKPPVFLMDEPLSNLDARLRLDMRSELKRLHHDIGVTTVYVTHDQTEAMTMANRVVVMKEGKIHQIGTPREIYHKPADLFVAEFVGMPRINLFSAKVALLDGRCWLDIGDFKLPVSWKPGKENVIAAIRPEDVDIALEPEPEAVGFKIYAILPSGPELFIQARRGSQTLIIRETRQLDLQMDQSIWINIDSSKINIYDKRNGLLLSPEDSI